MTLRSCRWTPLGPDVVRVPPATAGGRSTFQVGQASALLAEDNQVFVGSRSGIWRRSDRPLGPWVRATGHVDLGGIALVDSRPVFTMLRHGIVELVIDEVPAAAPAGALMDGGLFNGDPRHELLVQTRGGVLISRDGGGSFDPLWPGRTIGAAVWTGADAWVVAEGGTVHLGDASSLLPAGVGVLPTAATAGVQLFTTLVSTPADRKRVWAVFARIGITNDSFNLFAVFVTPDGGTTWTPVVPPPGAAANPLAAFYIEHNPIAFALATGLPAAVDPLDPDRLIVGLSNVWEVRNGATPTALVAQQVQAYALATTEERVWAATADGVRSIERVPAATSRFVERDRGRGPPEPTSGAHHRDHASIVVAAALGGGIRRSRAHPVWERIDAEGVDVAIRETRRQILVVDLGGLVALEGFGPPRRPLHRGESTPRLARAPSDERIAWFGGMRLLRLEGDVVRPVVEFDRHNPTRDFMTGLAVSPTDPDRVFVLMPTAIVQVDFRAAGSTATAIPLPTASQGSERSIAAGAADKDVVYLTVGVPRTTVRGPEPRIWRWDPGLQQWRDMTATVGAPGPMTPLNAVAVLSQSGGPDRIFVAGEGVWETKDLGLTWIAIGDGLPDVGVNALAVHETGRRLRAFTHGRGAWERNLDLPPCTTTPHEVELYLRSHDLDDGSRTSPQVDPIDGRTLTFEDATGLRVDARAAPKAGDPARFQSPVDLEEWGMDAVAFPQLASRGVTAGSRARIWIEAHNRGPDDASPVCWVAWAPLENGALPRVQDSFWPEFPAEALLAGGPWKVAGVRAIPRLQPGVPEVVRIDWDVPDDAPRDVGLIAVLHSDEDPVFEGINRGAMERDPTTLARTNRRVLVRKVKVAPGPPPRVDPADPKEPGEPADESKVGYWIAGAVVVVLLVLGAVWLARRKDD